MITVSTLAAGGAGSKGGRAASHCTCVAGLILCTAWFAAATHTKLVALDAVPARCTCRTPCGGKPCSSAEADCVLHVATNSRGVRCEKQMAQGSSTALYQARLELKTVCPWQCTVVQGSSKRRWGICTSKPYLEHASVPPFLCWLRLWSVHSRVPLVLSPKQVFRTLSRISGSIDSSHS